MKPLNEVTRQALEVLTKEIGIADTLRFLNQFTSGYGNYTEEREKLFEGMELNQILEEMKKSRSEENHE